MTSQGFAKQSTGSKPSGHELAVCKDVKKQIQPNFQSSQKNAPYIHSPKHTAHTCSVILAHCYCQHRQQLQGTETESQCYKEPGLGCRSGRVHSRHCPRCSPDRSTVSPCGRISDTPLPCHTQRNHMDLSHETNAENYTHNNSIYCYDKNNLKW